MTWLLEKRIIMQCDICLTECEHEFFMAENRLAIERKVRDIGWALEGSHCRCPECAREGRE